MNLTDKDKQIIKDCIDRNESLPTKYKRLLFADSKRIIDKSKPLYLYVINEINTLYYKIGISTNVKQRLKQLQRSRPAKLKIVFTKRISWEMNYERSLHKKYKAQNIRGEWFELSQEDVLDIKVYLNIMTGTKSLSKLKKRLIKYSKYLSTNSL